MFGGVQIIKDEGGGEEANCNRTLSYVYINR